MSPLEDEVAARPGRAHDAPSDGDGQINEDEPGTRRCAWCEATSPADATTCPACGAALAQREDLGGLTIPGVTSVHPELAAAADRPLRIPGQSPSQGAASGLITAAVLPGTAGLVVGGGIVALAAAEYLGIPGAGLSAPELEAVGRPSEAAIRAAARLDAVAAEAESGRVDGSASNSDNSTRD